jgi:hypothetical protein
MRRGVIHIPILRTKRLTVQLRELSMLDAIALASTPDGAHEAATSRFLAAAIERTEGGTPDPDDWTVQERTLAVTHYLASTLDDGPDFALDGVDEARYSHYLAGELDYPGDSVSVGEVAGTAWTARQLTGRMAGAIERTQGEMPEISGKAHWMFGRLAAQLVANDDPWPDSGDIDQVLMERMRKMLARPESEVILLQSAWLDANRRLAHLFEVDADADGLLVRPRSDLEGAADRPPARFPAGSCLSPIARGLGRSATADRA